MLEGGLGFRGLGLNAAGLAGGSPAVVPRTLMLTGSGLLGLVLKVKGPGGHPKPKS